MEFSYPHLELAHQKRALESDLARCEREIEEWGSDEAVRKQGFERTHHWQREAEEERRLISLELREVTHMTEQAEEAKEN